MMPTLSQNRQPFNINGNTASPPFAFPPLYTGFSAGFLKIRLTALNEKFNLW
jgi:hypothetical protein